LARRFQALPLSFADNTLTVAVSSDTDPLETVYGLENETGYTVDCMIADNADDLRTALRRFYPAVRIEGGNTASGLFQRLLNRAIQLRTSDIHICPDRNGADVRMRIDGALRLDRRLDPDTLTELTAVIKIAADLDIAEHRTPMDGGINYDLGGESVSLRIATIPTIYGEHITLRLADTASGNIFDISETITAGLPRKGSLRVPIILHAPDVVTGIKTSDDLAISPSVNYYDLNGRCVNSQFSIRNSQFRKGIVIERRADGSIRRIVR